MPVELTIKHNFPDVAAAVKKLSRDVELKVMKRSLDRTGAKVKTFAARELSKEFNLKNAQFKKSLRLKKARANFGSLFIVLDPYGGSRKGRAMNVIHFSDTKTTLSERKKRIKAGTEKDLHFKFKRVGGKKVIKGAFLGNRGRTVFQRTGDARLPIEPVQVIGIPQMFNTKRVNKKIVDFVLKEYPKQFDMALKHYLNRSFT